METNKKGYPAKKAKKDNDIRLRNMDSSVFKYISMKAEKEHRTYPSQCIVMLEFAKSQGI